jgi:S1-C subfamily serine protease
MAVMNISTFWNTVAPVARFVRHWAKELFIATILAIAAAVWIDHYHAGLEREQIARNTSAVAEIIAYKRHEPIAQGSGVFINRSGLLITNYHVLEGADDVRAKLSTGAYYQLREMKGADRRSDIAVLQFDAEETPSICGLGDSGEVEAGERVIAIGAPHALESSVSAGIVSNPKRSIQGVDLIQFTAPISPGSSGGGLFGPAGLLLGVTSATLTESQAEAVGQNQNINFAVPVNMFRNAIENKDAPIGVGTPEYYFSLGVMAESKRKWDGAVEYYGKAIAIDPNYSEAYRNLGGAYYEMGQYDQEVANYEKAAALDPGNYETQYWLGTAYEDEGKYAKAIDQYKAVIAVNPHNKDAIHDLILMDLASGEQDEAAALIPTLKDLDAGLGRKLELLVQHTR